MKCDTAFCFSELIVIRHAVFGGMIAPLDEFSPKKAEKEEKVYWNVIMNRSAAALCKSYDNACHATKEESLFNILLN